MYITNSFLSSFSTSLAAGNSFLIFNSLSLITVATIKKNKSIKTISGSEAVFTAGKSPFFFLLNFDILCLIFYWTSESFCGYSFLSLLIFSLSLSLFPGQLTSL